MERRLDQRGLAKRLLPASDPRLRALAEKRPLRVAADTVRAYAVIAAAFFALTLAPPWWVFVLCFVVIGTQQYALFIIAHDGVHSNVARRRTINDALTTALMLAPLGTRTRSGREGHMTHHRFLGSEGDPDRALHLASNKNTLGVFVLFLTGLFTLPRVLARILPFGTKPELDGPAPVAQQPSESALLRSVRARWPVLLAQALIFAAISAILPFWYYFVFWMLPVYVFVFLTDEIRAFCEHAQPTVSDEEGDRRRLITFVPNVLERIVFAPHNMNYHAEHHLWPFIPYYNLPKAHELIRACDQVEVRHSYVAFVWAQLRRLMSARTSVARSS